LRNRSLLYNVYFLNDAQAVLDTAEGGNFQKQTQRGEELRRVMSELKKVKREDPEWIKSANEFSCN